jgi:TolB protein
MKSVLSLLLGVGVLAISLGCERSLPLSSDDTEYFEVLASRVLVSPWQTVEFSAVPPTRELSEARYRWQASGGVLTVLSGTGLQASWHAPESPGRFAVSAQTTDREGRNWRGVVYVTVDPEPEHLLRIVFVSDRDGNPELYTIKPDGSDLRQLTFSDDVGHADPVWSPSLQRIAFVRYDLDDPDQRDLFIMHTSGLFLQQMTSDVFRQNSPTWAPGGLRVAYGTGTLSGFLIVAILDVDGYPEIRLSTTLGGLWPDWSVNNRIVFVKPAVPRARLTIVQSGGGRIASFVPEQDPFWPAWSPDGGAIAYVSPKTRPGSIFLIDAEGWNQRVLKTGLREVGPPSWSNDGRRLLFSARQDDGNWDLYTISVDGSGLKRLTFSPAADRSPHWAWLR